jgi:hypothetical protein
VIRKAETAGQGQAARSQTVNIGVQVISKMPSRSVGFAVFLLVSSSITAQAQLSNTTCERNDSNAFLFNQAGESPW